MAFGVYDGGQFREIALMMIPTSSGFSSCSDQFFPWRDDIPVALLKVTLQDNWNNVHLFACALQNHCCDYLMSVFIKVNCLSGLMLTTVIWCHLLFSAMQRFDAPESPESSSSESSGSSYDDSNEPEYSTSGSESSSSQGRVQRSELLLTQLAAFAEGGLRMIQWLLSKAGAKKESNKF